LFVLVLVLVLVLVAVASSAIVELSLLELDELRFCARGDVEAVQFVVLLAFVGATVEERTLVLFLLDV
jgi:hypothetical protein